MGIGKKGSNFKAYNSAYIDYITSKVTYDIVFKGAKAGYIISENLVSDLIGLIL